MQVQHELQPSRDIKHNKKRFYKYVRIKRKMKKSIGPLVNRKSKQIIDDTKKAEIFIAFLL